MPKKRRIEERAVGAYLLAEDGENLEGSSLSNQDSKMVTPKPTERSKLDQSELSRRLTGLLEHPSPQTNVLIPGISPRTPRVPSPQKGQLRLNDSPTIAQRLSVRAGREPAGNDSARVRRTIDLKGESRASYSNSSGKKPSTLLETDTDNLADDPDNQPLRARLLSKQSLGNFKVNPDYNQGYDYAFSDVVRKRDERMCLPGCTDPTCCGDKFRKLAETLLESRHGRQNTKADDEEDKRVLKDFLGVDYDRIRNMSKDERRETLLEAVTRDLSNKHGKHRHAYERRKSPPGFWRADFPTTQEEEQDREAAKKLERDKVKERYMSAMRGNGAWLFRDE